MPSDSIQYNLTGSYGRKIFTLGVLTPSILLLVSYTIFLIFQTNVAGSYKLVAIFLSTVIYSNILSNLFVVYLRQRV